MTLREFTEKIIKEYGLKFSIQQGVDYVTNAARNKAESGVCCLSDDDVKELLINAELGDGQKQNANVQETINEVKEAQKDRPKKVGKETDGQLDLFTFLTEDNNYETKEDD